MMRSLERKLWEDIFKDLPYDFFDGGLTQFINVFNGCGDKFVAVDKRKAVDERLFVIECTQNGRESRYLTVYIDGRQTVADINPNFSREIYLELLNVLLQTIDKILTNS